MEEKTNDFNFIIQSSFIREENNGLLTFLRILSFNHSFFVNFIDKIILSVILK